jgi:pilus assembly protein CpaB
MKLANISRPKISKTWLILGVAGIVGLLAAFVANNYLSNRLSDIEAKGKTKTVNLVVAKGDILKGATLDSSNVAVRAIPASFAQMGGVTPAQFEKMGVQRIAYDVPGGDMIMQSMLEGKKVPTFSERVQTGRRAITVPVDEISSISGMLEPGDLIDLVLTIDQKGKKIVAPMLQSIKVMATGQRSVDDPKSGERRTYSTVTLDTDLQQAQNLIVARETGKLTALLRNPGDKAPIAGIKGDLSAFLGASLDTPRAGASNSPKGMVEIPVLYGGKGGKFDANALNIGQESNYNLSGNSPSPTQLESLMNAAKAQAASK